MADVADRNPDITDTTRLNPYLFRVMVMRYRFAEQHLHRPGPILEIACGRGYGSYHLACHAPSNQVFGCDISRASIKRARRSYRRDNLHFAVSDVRELPFPNDYFSLAVSFETIEHILDGKEMLGELARVLAKDGELLCSTPNARYSRKPFDPRRPNNPLRLRQHLKVYSPEELEDLAAGAFKDVKTHFQFQSRRARNEELRRRYWQVGRNLLRFVIVGAMPDRVRRAVGQTKKSGSLASASTGEGALVIEGAPDYSEDAVRPESGGRSPIKRIIVVACKRPRRPNEEGNIRSA